MTSRTFLATTNATTTAEPSIAPLTVHEALLAYLKKHPVLDIARGGRSIATDLPRTVFSQDATLTGTTNALPRALRKK